MLLGTGPSALLSLFPLKRYLAGTIPDLVGVEIVVGAGHTTRWG